MTNSASNDGTSESKPRSVPTHRSPYSSITFTSLLNVASVHPFYNADVRYPPEWPFVEDSGKSLPPLTYEDLCRRPLLWKKDL